MSSIKLPNDAKLKPVNAICTQGFYDCLMSLVSHLQQIELFVDSPFLADSKPVFQVWKALLMSDQIVIDDNIVNLSKLDNSDIL